jgi:hypothetical protein
MDGETYNVVQWFPNEVYEYVRRGVTLEEAWRAAQHYCTFVGAKVGTTVRVMIEDGGGSCVLEWKREEGIVFPEEFLGGFKMGDFNAKPTRGPTAA